MNNQVLFSYLFPFPLVFLFSSSFGSLWFPRYFVCDVTIPSLYHSWCGEWIIVCCNETETNIRDNSYRWQNIDNVYWRHRLRLASCYYCSKKFLLTHTAVDYHTVNYSPASILLAILSRLLLVWIRLYCDVIAILLQCHYVILVSVMYLLSVCLLHIVWVM